MHVTARRCLLPPSSTLGVGLLSASSRLPLLLQVKDPLEPESHQAFYLPFLTCNLIINGLWSPL